MEIMVRSQSFNEGECIPKRYTCEGNDVSPQIEWTNFPQQTKSFVVLCIDPDVPHEAFMHWIVYGIPPEVTQLGEATPPEPVLPNGARQGLNDAGKIGYTGPCPPTGEHRYYFFVYALDSDIRLDPGADHADVRAAMQNRILAEGKIMGRYKMQTTDMDEIVDEIAEQAEEADESRR